MNILKNRPTSFIGAVAVNILILAALAGWYAYTLAAGTHVLLQIAPIDPTDLFRGDYITFQYDISQLEVVIDSDRQSYYKETVYVPLEQNPETDIWEAAKGAVFNKPSEGVFLTGVITKSRTSAMVLDVLGDLIDSELSPPAVETKTIFVDYGIGQYFIPDGAGSDVRFADFNMTAEVVIRSNGSAVLQRVFLDGEPWP